MRLAVALSLITLFTLYTSGQESSALTLETHITLPNVKGRIDHFSVDVKRHRLFVAAVENHTVEVIDLKASQVVHTIRNLPEPQGVFYDAAMNRIFVACGLDGTTKVFDGTTFQIVATVKFPDGADNIRYDERSKNVIVGYAGTKQLRKREEGAGGLGAIDSTGKKIWDIVIDAHPESFQPEKNGSRIFVNVPDKKEIEVIDTAKHAVLARWPVVPENNFPMALDEAHHRLFVGCWKPAQFLVFDTETGKQVSAGEIAGKTDDMFYDSSRGLIYVLTSVGFLEVFQREDVDHYDRIEHLPMPKGSQTGLFVPEWEELFIAVPAQKDQNAEVRVYRTHG